MKRVFVLGVLASGALMWILAVAIAGCAAFIGPATSGDAFMITCGEERCDSRWFECTTGKPTRCQAAFSVSRDAGDDR